MKKFFMLLAIASVALSLDHSTARAYQSDDETWICEFWIDAAGNPYEICGPAWWFGY